MEAVKCFRCGRKSVPVMVHGVTKAAELCSLCAAQVIMAHKAKGFEVVVVDVTEGSVVYLKGEGG